MPDLTTVSDFPPWDISYSYSVSNPVLRNTDTRGSRDQARVSQTRLITAQAKRKLRGDKLAYLEYFIRVLCNDGQLSFTDKYKDGSGVQSGEIRIVSGSYTVTYEQTLFIVDCVIEVLD